MITCPQFGGEGLLSRADCRQTFLYRITEGLPVVRTWLHHSFRTALESTIQCDTCVLRFMTAFELCIHDLTDSELKPSIERFASDLNGHGATGFVAERKGGNDSLQAHVVEEIFCIAREALTNAFRHSEAPRIVVELDYQKRKFVFSCRDNGRGFGPVALQASQTDGHWGLRGMAERAEKIGAKFSYASTPGKGTDVHVVVPARRAYVNRQAFRIFSRGGQVA